MISFSPIDKLMLIKSLFSRRDVADHTVLLCVESVYESTYDAEVLQNNQGRHYFLS